MKYNTYKLTTDQGIEQYPFDELAPQIIDTLSVIEKEIVNEYLKKQAGKLGIKNLGNEIRYNPILKNEFNNVKNNKIIIKNLII